MTPRRFLFIKPKHIGDVLLMTPAIRAVKEKIPGAEIDVLVREGTEGILAGCGDIRKIYTTVAPETSRRRKADAFKNPRLLLGLRANRYEAAFDLSGGNRGRMFAGLSGARIRVTHGHWPTVQFPAAWLLNQTPDIDWFGMHQVEKDWALVSEVIGLDRPIPPLTFEPERMSPIPDLDVSKKFVVVHVSTRWKRKRWAMENWVAVCEWLLAHGFVVWVSCGPSEEERAEGADLERACQGRVSSTDGRYNFQQLAWLLSRATLFVGVDTAVMHLAAACQTPVVTLFAPTNEIHWSPWHVPHRVVLAPRDATCWKADGRYDPADVSMAGITVEAVRKSCDEMLSKIGDAEFPGGVGILPAGSGVPPERTLL